MAFFEGLDAEGYDRQYSDKELVRRMTGYFSPYRVRMIVVVITIVIIALTGAAIPVLVARGLDVLAENITTLALLILPDAGIPGERDQLGHELDPAEAGRPHCRWHCPGSAYGSVSIVYGT